MSVETNITTANRLTLEALETIAATETNSDTRTRMLDDLLLQHGAPKLRTQRGIVSLVLMRGERKERPAHLCGPLAIHRSEGAYAVTHRATGLRVVRCRTLAAARVAMATLLSCCDWSFTTKEDAPQQAGRIYNALRRIVA